MRIRLALMLVAMTAAGALVPLAVALVGPQPTLSMWKKGPVVMPVECHAALAYVSYARPSAVAVARASATYCPAMPLEP